MKQNRPITRSWILIVGVAVFLISLGGCQVNKQNRQKTSNFPVETKSRYGNHSPYKVLGKRYHVLSTSKGYKEVGLASWYGKKFHGRLTSSREKYNMYEMTAAHKTLPLPTFARVTRVDTGQSVIVRINDRGPFHSDRIIDLSYAAAKTLGMLKKGTAKVKVEALTSPVAAAVWAPDANTAPHPLAQAEPENFTMAGDGPPEESSAEPTEPSQATRPLLQELWSLQVGAFSQHTAASEFIKSIHPIVQAPITIKNDPPWHRVMIGPLDSRVKVDELKARLAHVVPHAIVISHS